MWLFEHISLVVGDDEGGEREGDDETYETEQAAPDGEGEKDDGGVEASDFAHDAWGEHPVLDGLHHAEDDDGGKDDAPETLACVVGFEQGEDDGGDEANDLEIGHKVEEPDEESEGNGEGKVDDEESDGEEDADAEGNDRLSSEVAVHAFLQVEHDVVYDAALTSGHEFEEPFRHEFVIDQDEEEVDDGDEGGDEANDGTHAAADDGEELGHFLFEELRHVLHGQCLGDFVEVDVVLDVLLHLGGHGGDGGIGGDVFNDDVFQMPHLRDDGRNDEVASANDDTHDEQHGDDDAEDS